MSAVASQAVMPQPVGNAGYVSPAAIAAQNAVNPEHPPSGATTVADYNASSASAFNAANVASTAPPVTPAQTVGAGQFSVTPPPPVTITNPPAASNIQEFPQVLPYLTAEQNQANAQQYATLSAGENILGQGYQSALGQLGTAGASEMQQLQLQQQQTIGQSESQMAQAGLTGSSVDATATAQANRTYNLAATSLQEQVAAAKSQVIQQGAQAMAQYLAAPEYTNDNSTLLQGMAAQSNVQLSEQGLATQSSAASQANNTALTSAGIAGGSSLIGSLALLSVLASL